MRMTLLNLLGDAEPPFVTNAVAALPSFFIFRSFYLAPDMRQFMAACDARGDFGH